MSDAHLFVLPDGKSCRDCRHFISTCEWLISYTGDETACDWAPSRFRPRRTVEIVGPPTYNPDGSENPGTVHYRRLEGDPAIEEARRTPGYSVRLADAGGIQAC